MPDSKMVDEVARWPTQFDVSTERTFGVPFPAVFTGAAKTLKSVYKSGNWVLCRGRHSLQISDKHLFYRICQNLFYAGLSQWAYPK
jgi:hypothetical protein